MKKYQKEFYKWIHDNQFEYYIDSWFDRYGNNFKCDTDELYKVFLKLRK
jgi:hypothetical protein